MMKKILIFLIPIVLVFAFGFKPYDQPATNQKNKNGVIPYNNSNNPNQVLNLSSLQLEANQISTWFRNNGSFNRNPATDNSGFEWPKGSLKFARYASGLWIGAIVGSDTLVCIAEFSYEYVGGNIPVLGGPPEGQSDPNFKIYNISPTDTSEYQAWRTYAAPQGAYLDINGNPFVMGDQTQFYTYTDGYPAAHGNRAGSTLPLGAVILQTNWSYAANGPLSSMAFSEFRVINRSLSPWTNTYMAIWTDDDLGTATNDAIGCDTVLGLGFTFNSSNSDGIYGTPPPAVGYDYFRGPITPSIGDTVKYFSPPGSNNLVIKPNYKELGLTAFNFYTNGLAGASDPTNYHETYNNLQGIRADGTLWIDPNTNLGTLFPYSGNPETGTGWVMTTGDDRRFLQCSGPLTVMPNDTQSIVVGQIIAKGDNNLKSVTALKGLSLSAQRIFDNNFQIPSSPPAPVTSTYAPGNGRIYISWSDNAEKVSIPNTLSTGTYNFQGYNIYAIRNGTNGTESTDRTLIATYDIQDGIGDIKDSIFVEAYGTYVYTTVQTALDQGISRYIVIDRDYINNVLLVSGTPYKFAVTSYFYDSTANLNRNLTTKVTETPLSSATFTVTPQTLAPGVIVNNNVGDTVYTNQRDLGAMPIIIDPLSLVSATYKATYGGTPTVPTWTLSKTVNGSTSIVVPSSTDFTGQQDTAQTVDGFLTVFQTISDSGIIVDPANADLDPDGKNYQTRQSSWTYSPSGGQWFTAPDTTIISTGQAKVIQNRQFQSRSLGMSFPTTGQFSNKKSRVFANGGFLKNITATSPILTGGPLRRIQIVFGVNSKAYRYIPTDTNVISSPIASTVIPGASDYVDVPFSAYMADDLDSTGGLLRQMNIGFLDYDSSGTWNPDTTALGGYEFVYFLASTYSATADVNYTNKNPATASPVLGFAAMDVMYGWLPRVKNVNGVPLTWMTGDTLTVTPYRLTKNQFLPGDLPGPVFPISYSWTVDGTSYNNSSQAANQMTKIKAFPNPYFGGQALETDPFARFINFNHLPSKCNIYIYALNGVLVRQIQRDNSDPNNSIERWDMLNSNQIPVASGMYIVYIDAGSIGVTTLKIAIFTPTERIQTF